MHHDFGKNKAFHQKSMAPFCIPKFAKIKDFQHDDYQKISCQKLDLYGEEIRPKSKNKAPEKNAVDFCAKNSCFVSELG